MKLKLVSDFHDYYDIMFDKEGLEFRRFTNEGPNRIQIFSILRGLGLKTPFFGKVEDLLVKFSEDTKIVVYTDITKHCGEGKELITLGEAKNEYRGFWASQYIRNELQDVALNTYKGKSTRFLFVGNRFFRMDYISTEDWRSNVGDGDIIGCHEEVSPKWRNMIYFPLYSIDFVGEYELFAIDFNIAPGTIGTGLNKILHPSDAVNAIKKWYKETCNV